MLKEKIAAEVQEPVVTSEWRASEVGECETFLCHMRLGHAAIPFTGRVRHMLDDGLLHERDIIDRVRSKGVKVLHSYVEGQAQVTCYESDDLIVIGHPDGVLDIPGEFELDYVDDRFRFGNRFYTLEVTAPSHFTFMRLERNHIRRELYRKFVQIQMYLNSEHLKSFGDSCVAVIKNKNTSALYEEGIGFDRSVVDETIEKLKKVTDLTLKGVVSAYRCDDWRRYYCRYRELCYGEPIVAFSVETQGILEGESLSEAEQLLEAADLWLKGKGLEADSKELIDEARALFWDTLVDYNARGLTIGQVRAMMVHPMTPRKNIDFDMLKQQYPDVYNAVVTEELPNPYLRCDRR